MSKSVKLKLRHYTKNSVLSFLLAFYNLTTPQTPPDILCASFFNTTDKMTSSTMHTGCMTNILYKTWPGPHDVTLHAIKSCKDRQQSDQTSERPTTNSPGRRATLKGCNDLHGKRRVALKCGGNWNTVLWLVEVFVFLTAWCWKVTAESRSFTLIWFCWSGGI